MSKPKPPQHLYLLLDDSEDGYSIRKIDVGGFDPEPDADTDLDSRAERLPDPPLVRMALDADRRFAMYFVALGTKIFAMHPSPIRAVPAYDTKTMALTVGPRPRGNALEYCGSVYVPVGDRLYGMDDKANGRCNFEVLTLDPPRGKSWSWSSVSSQPPFDPHCTVCYAVHPDGRTIFFSTPMATFSFDTERLKWTRRGSWTLPFEGRAHYDVELDAWVGLYCHPDLIGRICSCDVLPSTIGDGVIDKQAPAWKLCEEEFFSKNKKRHKDGVLEYMGSSTFCILECVTQKLLTKEEKKKLTGPPRLLLYVRTFSLNYGKAGQLRKATCGRRARCYILPEGTSLCDFFEQTCRPFWM